MKAHELRLTRRLLNYWQMLRKTKPHPSVAHFNPAAMEDVWQHCVKLSLEPQGDAYRYEYMGDGIKRAYGHDLTGKIIDQNSASNTFPGTGIFKKLKSVRDGVPVEDEGHFLNTSGSVVKYRACLLPFGDKKDITHVIIGFSCRDFK